MAKSTYRIGDTARRSGPAAGSRHKVYLNVDGQEISPSHWTTLRGNPDYYILKRYENDRFGACVEWLGAGDNPKVVPREYWKLFKVAVYNVIITGDRPGTFVAKRIEDPVLTKHFNGKEEALSYYQQLLEKMGLLRVERDDYLGTEEVVEIGNKFAPQEETNKAQAAPDAPQTKKTFAGSW